MDAYRPRFLLIFVSNLRGFCHSSNFSRFFSRLSVKPPFRRTLFLLSNATFGDRIVVLGETVDMFQFGVPKRSIFNNLVKILRGTVQLVDFFVGHLGCRVLY